MTKTLSHNLQLQSGCCAQVLNFGHWNLFDFCYLGFYPLILKTKSSWLKCIKSNLLTAIPMHAPSSGQTKLL
jgi:hypothetical protein